MKEKLQEGLNLEDEEPRLNRENVSMLIDTFFRNAEVLDATWNEILTANATIASTVSAYIAREAGNMEQTYKELLQMQNDRMSAMIDDIKYLLSEQEFEALKEIALEQTEQE